MKILAQLFISMMLVLSACTDNEKFTGGAGADVDMSNYYTKTEVNALIQKNYAYKLYDGNYVEYYGSFASVAGFSVSLTTTGGDILVTATLSGYNKQYSSTYGKMRFTLDGTGGPAFQMTYDQYTTTATKLQHSGTSLTYLFTNVAAGTHEIGIQIDGFRIYGSQSTFGNSFMIATEL